MRGPGRAAIRSRVLTVEVERVLGRGAAGSVAGADPAVPEGTVVLVEEEHALADGARLVVDGMRPGRVGDRGVWFLVAGGDPDFPAYALVNAQGRCLFAGRDALVGGDRSDALVRRIEGRGRTTLESTLLAPTPTPTP